MSDEMTAFDRLASFVRRIESLLDERDEIGDSVKEVYHEAKGEDFDAKIIRKVIAKRRKDQQKLREEDEMILLYEAALGRAGTNSPGGRRKMDPIKEGE